MTSTLTQILQSKELTRAGCTVDCSEIRLEQNGGERRTWRLPGALNINFNEGISARLVSFGDDRPMLCPFHSILVNQELRSGELIPESHFFTLTATDVDGHVWSNPSVKVREAPYENCAIIEMHCDWVRTTYTVPSAKNQVRMLFREELDVPLNDVQHTQIKSSDRLMSRSEKVGAKWELTCGTLRYEKSDAEEAFNTLRLIAKEGTQLPANMQSKLIEAIRFVSASSVSFCASETIDNELATLEFAVVKATSKGLFPAPLVIRAPEHVRDFYKIFDAFLEYAVASSNDEFFSPIARKFNPLYGLRGVPLESVALLVSVTVEAIVMEQFPDVGQPNEQVLMEVSDISAAIDALTVSERTKLRAKGSLGGLKRSRADDKLNVLKDRGVLSELEIKAWKGLRNSSAHGSLHVKPDQLQLVFNRVFTAATLLNKLALLSIGYQGKYSDYSIPDWPVRDFQQTQFPADPIDHKSAFGISENERGCKS